jgi:hypothetical protein
MPNNQAPGVQNEEFRAGGEWDRGSESAQAWPATEAWQDYRKIKRKQAQATGYL